MQDIINKRIDSLNKEIESLKTFSFDKFWDACEQAGIKQFSWTQYTPYFNDGDPCEFGVREEMLDITIDGFDDEFSDEYELYDYVDREKIFPSPTHKKAYEFNFIDALGLSEDLMHDLFGDHAMVVANVESREFSTSEYDHD